MIPPREDRLASPIMNIRARILDAAVSYVPQSLVTPLILSTGAIRKLTEVVARVRVSVDGKDATGVGSIYLSDLWAWPDAALRHEAKQQKLRELCDDIAGRLKHYTDDEAAHPLELGLRLYDGVCHTHAEAFANVPVLARAMCLSPFDAAIHDAVGIAVNHSAFDFYDAPVAIPSADVLFDKSDGGACGAIARTFLSPPRTEFPAWLIVGKNDDLDRDVRPWAVDRGYRCFKLKIMGKDNAADVARTVDLFRACRRWNVHGPWLTVDSNEANPDAASVLDYLDRLRAADAGAYAALQYLEQPTGRDIRQHVHDWRAVSKLKPVMLDEGLTDFALLPEAAAQGWTGLALKSCKGHSFTLVAAAWARAHGMLISLQDLTNAGHAMIHAALLAANLPTINGVELNSPQFTPVANEPWLPRLAGLFAPRDGMHRMSDARPAGLGSKL
jgi:L-alanine-DL-glutamate epimerase-like enolase superfamily enzyme